MLALLCLMLLVSANVAYAQTPRVEVTLTGIADEIHDPVLDTLSIERQKDHPLLNEALVQRLYRQGIAQLKTALQPYGYYRASIEPSLRRDGDNWQVIYHVTPGPPLPIGSVDLQLIGEGANDEALRQWRESFPLQKGEVLQHAPYEEAKGQLLRLARERGYLRGDLVQHEIVVDLNAYQANISLHYDSGPRYRFGPVRFVQDAFEEDYVARFVPFRPGDPYSASELLRLQRNLADSEQFENIEVSPKVEEAVDLQVPIEVTLIARPPSRYTFGLGYGTDTGARGRIGYERRRLNTSGHRFGSELRVSEIGNHIDARYRIPLENPSTDFLAYTAVWEEERTETSTRRTTALAASVTRLIWDWQRTFTLSLEREEFVVGTDEGVSQLVIPQITLQRVRIHSRTAPTTGWRVAAILKGAAEQFASDTTFTQGVAHVKYILRAGDNSRLIARGSAGSSWVDEFSQLPASQRFFAGGDYSVRGYAYNSLGPKDAAGNVIGGENLLVGSVEYEQILTQRFGAAIFYDVGNAYDVSSVSLAEGAGIGLRWRLLFGTLGLDVAWALSEPDRPYRIHLTIGPEL